MARQDQVYAGTMTVNGEAIYGELWIQGDAAAVFERPANTVNVTLQDVVLTVADERLVVTGHRVDDSATVTVVCTSPEQPLGLWSGAQVTLADGTVLNKATVNWTQYRVVVKAAGEVYQYPGAAVRQSGANASIAVPVGDDFTMYVPRAAGCIPCGAKRRP